jgi:hypothetical protein
MFKVFAITLCKIVNFSLKAKVLSLTLARVRYLISFILLLFFFQVGYGQVEPQVKTPSEILPVKADTSKINPDSIIVAADTLQRASDTTKTKRGKGDIETTINYSARDSIRASVDNQIIWLYGEAKIKYGEIELEAEEITIDYANSTLTAHGIRDSLGHRVGYPIFKNGAELYETKDIIYNYKTKRARISEVVTQQGEAYIHGAVVYKNEKGELLSMRNSYTTCNLEHPHFLIRATKTKAIPNDKIVAGPFYFEFNDIPLPLGFLFGMFPSPRRSASGILFPSYGEERRRGFNLRGGGYFFDINEYIKLSLTGDIYSKGGHALYVNSSYMKRYKYTGTVNFAYSKNPETTDKIENKNFTKDFRISWSHSPQSKGTGRFAASVNAATATFNKNNFLSYGTSGGNYNNPNLNNTTAKLNSNISYSKRFARTPLSLGVNFNHSQDLLTRAVDMLLPNLSLNMTNIYPFQSKSGKTGPLDNFSVGYTMNAMNRITNNLGRIPPKAPKDSIAAFTGDNLPMFFTNARNGIRHTLPTSFSFKALRFFTVSPSVNYEEKWYGQRLDWAFNEEGTGFVKKDTIRDFSRISNYSFSASITTRIYGMYTFKKTSRIKAIRHVINPTVSYNYTPDFTKDRSYFQEFTDKSGRLIYQDRYEGFAYGGSNRGNSSAIGFGLGNNVEMKVQGAQDSVARKVMLLNNLSINSSYNFIADSFKLAPISISANTNILDNLLNINLSASLDPYYYKKEINEAGIIIEDRVDQLVWKTGGVGRITNATLAMSTNLNPKARNKNTTSREKIGKSNLPEAEKKFLLQNPDAYVDFDIPWSMNVNYNLNYSHSENVKPNVVQTINATGDFSLSEKWKVTYSTGYDFKAKDFTITNFGIARDLHCWTMRVDWTPFGRFQQFFFTINVKSSLLQDLKLERRKPFYDNL